MCTCVPYACVRLCQYTYMAPQAHKNAYEYTQWRQLREI